MPTRLILVMSDGDTARPPAPFDLSFDNAYAAGFASHWGDYIVQTITHPAILPEYLDDPVAYLPDLIVPHDVMIAINIHEEILLELPSVAAAAGGQAIVVPREDPAWTTPWSRDEVARRCAVAGLEAAFPKPFCSLVEDPSRPTITAMMRDLKIGRPEMTVTVRDNVVVAVDVVRSAPCGDTYYVAQNLTGKAVDDKLEWWAAKYWGSYPCRASMAFDPDFNDNMQHAAGHILIGALRAAIAAADIKVDSKENDES